MKGNEKRLLFLGVMLIAAFVIWTLLIQSVDVQPIGVNASNVGFATLNAWFHQFTGVHMMLYQITDWLGLVPLFICMLFGGVGLVQFVKRRSLFRVDYDILLLGVYYVVEIVCYLVFEMIPINYRPVLIEGVMEASYPPSTTLLVLSVMPTLIFQVNRRFRHIKSKRVIRILVNIFSVFMVIGRMVSGVHWFTDFVGSIILSSGVFCVYQAVVLLHNEPEN